MQALQTRRGVDLMVTVTFVTEVGDVTRFESPRQGVPRAVSGGGAITRVPQRGQQTARRWCCVTTGATSGSSIRSETLTISSGRAACRLAPQHAHASGRCRTIVSGSSLSIRL